MKVSLVTDELSADPQTAFELGTQWGVFDYELRGYFTDRVPAISTYQRTRLRHMIADYGVAVTAISPGLFKLPFPVAEAERSNLGWMDRAMFADWEGQQHLLESHAQELLPAAIDFALEFAAPYIIAFSFHRGHHPSGPAPQRVVDFLRECTDRVHAAGLTLLIETEAGYWADTGARSAALIEAVAHPGIAINWDPANSFCSDDISYPDGYRAVRGHVRNVHFKDASCAADGQKIFVGDGEIDWPGQIEALAQDGYDGYIAIEPHLQPRVPAVHSALERLRVLLADTSRSDATPE